jgi:hypothetical protein
MVQWLESHVGLVGVLGALTSAAVFLLKVWQFIDVRRREQRAREFDAFHRLIKELVSPDEKDGATRADRQIAAVFELRHLTRYYEVAARILVSLREQWSGQGGNIKRLVDEMDRTLSHIRKGLPRKLRAEILDRKVPVLPSSTPTEQK